jgi:iron complex outermembrane receptor protein
MRKRWTVMLQTALVVMLSTTVLAQTAGSLAGEVLDSSGRAIAGADVTVFDSDDLLRRKASTDAGGSFSFSGLPPGRYTIQVERREFATQRVQVEVAGTTPTHPLQISMKVQPVQQQVTVSAEGYAVSVAGTATKTETRIEETPVSIEVVPSQVIQDQRANTVTAALENVSGIRSYNNDVEGYTFNIRGFESLNMFRDGLIESYQVANIKEAANVERIEVLKGPASVLFGRIDPGGVINRVTKKPLFASHYGLDQEFGSDSHFRTVWDASGPLGTDAFAYRVSGAFQDFDSFRQFQGGRRTFVAPAVTWKPRSTTVLTVDAEYLHNHAQSDMGQPAVGDRPARIPISRSFQEAGDPRDKTGSFLIAYDFKQSITEAWSITNRFHHAQNLEWDKLNVALSDIEPDERTLDRVIQYQALPNGRVDTTNLDLTGSFNALGVKQNLLAGLDFIYNYTDYEYAENLTTTIDIFQPVYGTIPQADISRSFAESGFTFFSATENKQTGLYLQDGISIRNKLHVLLGGRYDWSRRQLGTAFTSPADASAAFEQAPRNKDNFFSPRVGALYQVAGPLAIYGSFSQSFGTNNGITANGEHVDPEMGRQVEGGIKATGFQGRVNVNLAVYRLTKTNILTPDLSTPNPTDVVPIGESRSLGVELDVLGQLTTRMDVIGNYAYTDARVIEDNGGLQGTIPRGVPRHSGAAFLMYDLGRGGAGWRVGGGITASGDRPGDSQNSFILPAYARLDAVVAYRRKWGPGRWVAQLNVQNLADTGYYVGTDIFYNYSFSPRTNIFPGQARAVIFTVRFER